MSDPNLDNFTNILPFLVLRCPYCKERADFYEYHHMYRIETTTNGVKEPSVYLCRCPICNRDAELEIELVASQSTKGRLSR